MKQLTYSVSIKASQEQVWDALTDPVKYRKWAKAFSPNSQFSGKWEQGQHIRFIDPDMGGTNALIEELVPLERIHVRHVGMINQDGSEDINGEMAQNWIGSTETYTLTHEEGVTTLAIEILTHPDFKNMFEDAWPKAIKLIKLQCE